MTRLFSIVAVGLEGLMGVVAAHRQYESLSAQMLTMAVTVLPTATMIAGWLLARGASRANEEFSFGEPRSRNA